MKFQYESQAVQKYFGDFELMQRKIGKDLTKSIKKRCDQLKAADNFAIYLDTGLGKPHPLTGNLKGYFGISVSGQIRLIVKPIVESFDLRSFQNCDSVIIKGVMDYHGSKHEWLIP
ncbi:MAG TPA: hypothetical protein GXX34_08765 [Clostridia bacterium]|nr:hypothetical protein [Clostridia bacterium]